MHDARCCYICCIVPACRASNKGYAGILQRASSFDDSTAADFEEEAD